MTGHEDAAAILEARRAGERRRRAAHRSVAARSLPVITLNSAEDRALRRIQAQESCSMAAAVRMALVAYAGTRKRRAQ